MLTIAHQAIREAAIIVPLAKDVHETNNARGHMQHFSLPSHIPGHVDCPACNARSLVRVQNNLADMCFRDVFNIWLSSKRVQTQAETSVRYIAKDSERTYGEYAWALEKFFGPELPLKSIHDGHLRCYQDARAVCAGDWKRPCGQNRIRKEVSLLKMVMKLAKVWSEDLNNSFDLLPVKDADIIRAPEPRQVALLLAVMLKKDEWLWIYYWSVLSLATCASTLEIRMLRLKDVNLEHRTVRVGPEASKNKFRNRTIPIESQEALDAAAWLVNRARRLGCYHPDHFLLPFGVGSKHAVDPTQPMTKYAMKNSWNLIRKRAGLPHVRPYDLRHIAITRRVERGDTPQQIMPFSGHIGAKMLRHYTAVSMEAKRALAADPLLPPKLPPHRVEVIQWRGVA